MGDQTLRGKRRSHGSDSSACSSSSASLSHFDSDSDSRDRRRRKEKKKHGSSGGGERHRSRRDKDCDRKQKEKSSSSRKRRKSSRREEEDEERKRRRRRKRKERERRRSRKEETTDSDSSSHSSDSHEETAGPAVPRSRPGAVVTSILNKFPEVAGDLKQLLQMVDSGQAVDIRGIPNKPLVKLLDELFHSLDLQKVGHVFLLPAKRTLTLDAVGKLLDSQAERSDAPHNGPSSKAQSPSVEMGTNTAEEEGQIGESDRSPKMARLVTGPMPRRRVIGPEMPSSELLAAAAELTAAEAALRDAEVTDDFFIGPPPPAVAAEAESANEGERFEEVERIVEAEVDKPYDVLGVNHKMPFENIKKRYWKLSLMVHPDKCSHPQAHQAFVILNQAFKELQDPDKRKEIDDKIKLKEEEEAFKIELKALREAAQWRRLQGISLEGDEELLAEQPEAKGPPKRDEWMTQLPPERKPGMPTQTTFFSRTGKEGRGDTSAWTDNPLDRADKAKQKYLEAYDKATALASADNEKKGSNAELVDMYNRSKRSISLVQKHQEEIARPKKKKSRESDKEKEKEKEDWVGKHPWKPWDRENDLAAGRKKVNLDPESMTQGLASRFSSGTVQRNFL